MSLVVFSTYEAVLTLKSCCQDSVVALYFLTTVQDGKQAVALNFEHIFFVISEAQ
jgi:hypothetical protein